ncbi:MAG: sigma-70 family RNA polymerase sigma factor [Oscillospiraceae bacterium]|nr:sigma-70 family RNA polymerase sigma factor [Oscillospiraceae bacterium]MBQ8883961.1 sigma-70 family RNA polymerase sigma factor [Oscillospiraceae bacterium]
METNKNQLCEKNLGLVHLCANRFRGKGIDYDDLYSAGCVGLVKACNAFDEERGVKLSTYAVPVILGEIKRLFRDGGTVRVSRSVKENSLRIAKLRDSFFVTEGREPTINELSQLSSLEKEDVIEALNVSLPPLSLTESDDEGGGEIDIPTVSPDEEITNSLSISQLLEALDVRDRRLIYLRYFKDKTQMEVAKTLDMTQVQVSRREKKLLSIMRQQLTV